jgi:hypothetical protein
MVDCNSTMKNHIHGSMTKLWSNKQDILQILIIQSMNTSKP